MGIHIPTTNAQRQLVHCALRAVVTMFSLGGVVCAVALAPLSRALWFDLEEATCVTARLHAKDITFDYEVKRAGEGNNIKLEIRDVTHRDLLKTENPLKESNSIKLHVPEYDHYEFCFKSTDHMGRPSYSVGTSISIKMKEDDTTIDTEHATKDFAKGLKPIDDMVSRVLRETMDLSIGYEHMRKQEADHRSTSENTHDRLLYLSLLSIFALLGVGVYQVIHLKTFFRKKKMI